MPHETPGFYALIPATVRYDSSLPPNAKLLYGEITALADKMGYCWAGNAYFAKLYDCHENTIHRWLAALRNAGHIVISYRYVAGTREIESREIRLPAAIPQKPTPRKETPPAEKPPALEPPQKEATPGKDVGGGDKNDTTYGQNCPEVGTFLSTGGDKNVQDIITNINTISSSTAPPINNGDDRKPPSKQDTAAADNINITKIKDALSSLDKRLIFDDNFYRRFNRLLRDNNLDMGYFKYIYSLCLKKKPDSLSGYFLTMLFADNQISYYAELHKPAPPKAPPPPPQPVTCPVCGASHPPNTDCPSCSLPSTYENRPDLAKKFAALPEDKKALFLKKREHIHKEFAAHHKLGDTMRATLQLEKEFNLC